ncbi:MAG: hypothetical protein KIT22_15265, partial [Verrucomicrobiae bacterium]|nr:hypothetical protein [Verrucomicrobiae bacterium]
FQSVEATAGLCDMMPVELRPLQAGGHDAPPDPSLRGQPASGVFAVPIEPEMPARFFRLLWEPWPSRGRALVFLDGALDFEAMRSSAPDGEITRDTPWIYKEPAEVWVSWLGYYDTNGLCVAGNNGNLTGKFLETFTSSGTPVTSNGPLPRVPRVRSPWNDFHIPFAGDAVTPSREAILWSSETQIYFDAVECHLRFFNAPFIRALGLEPQMQEHLLNLHYRPDLEMPGVSAQVLPRKPEIDLREQFQLSGLNLYPWFNSMEVPARIRANYTRPDGTAYVPGVPLSLIWDTGVCVGDYLGMIAFQVAGTNNTPFPPEDFYGQKDGWQTNMLPVVNDAISAWCAFRMFGQPEICSTVDFMYRLWGEPWRYPDISTELPLTRGRLLRNCTMFDESNNSNSNGLFPFASPGNIFNGVFVYSGPGGSDLSCLYLAAIYYDLAVDAGLGLRKADLAAWKTISLITNNQGLLMRDYGALLQEAARQLWPDTRPGRAGLSRYEEDIGDVLASRGIPVGGVAGIEDNLPPAIGDAATMERPGSATVATDHPAAHPGINDYGQSLSGHNGYVHPDDTARYVAYQFYKHSKLGPLDTLQLTDGTFDSETGRYRGDGSFFMALTDRTPGNLVVLAPGRTLRFRYEGRRGTNEFEGFYVEDVTPFGFRIIGAQSDGYSFTVERLSETPPVPGGTLCAASLHRERQKASRPQGVHRENPSGPARHRDLPVDRRGPQPRISRPGGIPLALRRPSRKRNLGGWPDRRLSRRYGRTVHPATYPNPRRPNQHLDPPGARPRSGLG